MKKRKVKIIKDPKLRGEWVESVFVARVSEQELAVSKPWGDSKSFDFVVGRSGRFVSVQVKSTTVATHGGYMCTVKKNNQRYARGSFDFLAAYVIPEDVWYIVPARKFTGRVTLILCSQSGGAKYEEYRERWDLLRKAAEGDDAQTSGGGDSLAEESSGKDSGAGECEANPPPGVVGRMRAVESYVRNFFERGSAGPQKLGKESEREEEV
jgi:PD-(D/E)XK endonuclease